MWGAASLVHLVTGEAGAEPPELTSRHWSMLWKIYFPSIAVFAAGGAWPVRSSPKPQPRPLCFHSAHPAKRELFFFFGLGCLFSSNPYHHLQIHSRGSIFLSPPPPHKSKPIQPSIIIIHCTANSPFALAAVPLAASMPRRSLLLVATFSNAPATRTPRLAQSLANKLVPPSRDSSRSPPELSQARPFLSPASSICPISPSPHLSTLLQIRCSGPNPRAHGA
ncbi:hypothetical protein ACQKWADRAFT_28622 [Trichoderma austrokoningii]